MATYTEVPSGSSSVDEETSEIDMREPVRITIDPVDGTTDTVRLTEHFRNHKPQAQTFDRFDDLVDYLRGCLTDQGESDDEQEGE